MIDIFIDNLPTPTIRERYRAKAYGKISTEHMKGWLTMRGSQNG